MSKAIFQDIHSDPIVCNSGNTDFLNPVILLVIPMKVEGEDPEMVTSLTLYTIYTN